MTRTLCIALAALGIASCDGNTSRAGYTVGGSVTGGIGVLVRLDEWPVRSHGQLSARRSTHRRGDRWVALKTEAHEFLDVAAVTRLASLAQQLAE